MEPVLSQRWVVDPCCIDLEDELEDDFLSVGRNLEADARQIQSQCPLRISRHVAQQAATAYPGDLPRAIAHACRLCCSPPRGRVHASSSQGSRSRSPPERPFAPAISVASVDASSALRHGPEPSEAPRSLHASIGLPCFAADPQAEVEHYFSTLANSSGLAAQDGNFWTSVPMYSQYILHHSFGRSGAAFSRQPGAHQNSKAFSGARS